MPFRGLAGKVAVVTGAAGGIGGAVVDRLVEEGVKVVAVDLHAPRHASPDVFGVAADVSTEQGCDRYVATAVGKFGAVDLFVNNAGIVGHRAPMVEIEVAEFDRVHAVNVRGVFLGLRAVLRRMIAQGKGGAIVNTSSVGGLKAFPGATSYGSAKRAVIALSATAALENGRHGIRVNAICPGAIATPMLGPALASAVGGDGSGSFSHLPIPRVAAAAEVAAFVAYLLSDEASFQTGGAYTIDGGLMLL